MTNSNKISSYDRRGMLEDILAQFKISKVGVHGPNHWARVRHHGVSLGAEVGADLLVVELFAFLHDSQRLNEFEDRLHGDRAAEYAASLNHRYFDLYDKQLKNWYMQFGFTVKVMWKNVQQFRLAGMLTDLILAGLGLSLQ